MMKNSLIKKMSSASEANSRQSDIAKGFDNEVRGHYIFFGHSTA